MGKITNFDKTSCRVYDADKKLIAIGSKVGCLYYLNCYSHHVNVADNQCHETKASTDAWDT